MASFPLASKYRMAWTEATDLQRESICQRLGLQYTSVGDEGLLTRVANKQQGEYDRIRLAQVSTPDNLNTGSSSLLKSNKRKVEIG